MCNSLYEDSKPISKEGLGWKVFEKINSKLYPWASGDRKGLKPYIPGKWYRWSRPQEGDGFCFILTRSEARKFQHISGGGDVIRRIEYRGGLGCHFDDYLCVKMAICKQFRIIE